MKSRIYTLQRQESKSINRVQKLEKAKSTVIEAKVRRDEVKTQRVELGVRKQIELEVKKVRAAELKRVEDTAAKRVKEEVLRRKHEENER